MVVFSWLLQRKQGRAEYRETGINNIMLLKRDAGGCCFSALVLCTERKKEKQSCVCPFSVSSTVLHWNFILLSLRHVGAGHSTGTQHSGGNEGAARVRTKLETREVSASRSPDTGLFVLQHWGHSSTDLKSILRCIFIFLRTTETAPARAEPTDFSLQIFKEYRLCDPAEHPATH